MKKSTGGVKSDNKPYDTAFKELAEQDPETLLRLVGALPEGAIFTPLPREVTAPALYTDQPYLVTTERGRHVTHIEAQTYYDHDVPPRNVKYGAILWVNTDLPVHSYVLILSPRGMPDDAPTEMTIEAGGITLTVRYHLIRLWEIDAQEALAWKRENLLPFVPLMKGGRDELIEGAQALGQIGNEARKRELALHFLMLSGLRYTQAEILDVIGRYSMVPLHQLKDSSFYQFILNEGREEGREAVVKMLLYMIGKRFPGLDVKAEVEFIEDLEALTQLGFDLDQLADADALRKRLNELVVKN
jgi:predicted transposase YdaD